MQYAKNAKIHKTRFKPGPHSHFTQFNRYANLCIGIALGAFIFSACDPDWDTYDPLKGPISGQGAQSSSSGTGGAGGGGGAGGNSMVCTPGDSVVCYTGFPATLNIGTCKAGTSTCNADGTAYGACENQVLPMPEDCATPTMDENCDGALNEGCP